MHLAFVTTGLTRPSFRFRIGQMLPFFEQKSHTYAVEVLPKNRLRRWSFFRGLSQYDAVVVQQRLFSRLELGSLRRHSKRLIYDLDDAVMLGANPKYSRRYSVRFRAMARAADLLICGNAYLAERASEHTDRVLVIPTAVDTDRFRPQTRRSVGKRVTIGWTGSASTNAYLNEVFPVLGSLPEPIRVKVMSSTLEQLDLYSLGEVPFDFVEWSPEVEVTTTAGFDIGLMPLPDTPWSRGKCGCKALQYMALGIPAVCSPVGVNSEIIQHGVNGFLASSPSEWRECLLRLVRDPDLRAQIGQAGRQTAESRYSLALQGEKFLAAVEQVADKGLVADSSPCHSAPCDRLSA